MAEKRKRKLIIVTENDSGQTWIYNKVKDLIEGDNPTMFDNRQHLYRIKKKYVKNKSNEWVIFYNNCKIEQIVVLRREFKIIIITLPNGGKLIYPSIKNALLDNKDTLNITTRHIRNLRDKNKKNTEQEWVIDYKGHKIEKRIARNRYYKIIEEALIQEDSSELIDYRLYDE